MRNPARSLRRAQSPSPLPLHVVREIAVDVARAALVVIQERRWAQTPRSVDAYAKCIAIVTIDDDLGAVCDADYAEMRIRDMAEAAHGIVQAARADLADGMAFISRVLDCDLVDPTFDDALACVYAVVAIRLA